MTNAVGPLPLTAVDPGCESNALASKVKREKPCKSARMAQVRATESSCASPSKQQREAARRGEAKPGTRGGGGV